MKSARLLRRKKTNLATALANAFTMNAPGTFPVPYGATAVLVGGRGSPGNAPVAGNIAQSSYYVPGRYTPGNYLSGGNYEDGGYAEWYPTYMWGSSYTVYTHETYGDQSSEYGDHPWGPSTTQPPTRTYTANITPNDPPGYWAGYSVVNYNVEGINPGYTYYNPEYYNPTYYNPPVYTPAYTNPTYYNPSNPGTAGTPANIGGVTLPGGAASSTAQIVSPLMSNFSYQRTGISVTVPHGGYVVLTPIGG